MNHIIIPIKNCILGLWLCCCIFSVNAAEISTEVISVSGITKPVEILTDSFGVPHIYAMNENDVFFAQGFNAARNRLFQIDTARRRGLGQLAEIFGEDYVEQDRASRLFLYRGDMQAEWNSYASDAKKIATQFTAGINAYIDWLSENPEHMPLEFIQWDYFPAKWSAEDIVRIRSHALAHNLSDEVARAKVVCKADLKVDAIRSELQPPWQTQIPNGLDTCLPDDVLHYYDLATKRFVLNETPIRDGSNAWVVSSSKSTTGRAILASDPHRALSVPSLRYITHLHTPTLNIIGANEPFLPGISIGHNGTIAFGLTFFSIDQDDLYVYELNPDNPKEYIYQSKGEAFKILREKIKVHNGADVVTELWFTRHGPVIYQDEHRAYAVRSVWSKPGTTPYFGSIGFMRAKNFQQFKDAMHHSRTPPSNLLYADEKGNIGWVSTGLAPKRPNWDGLLPVPGDGRYEWAGFWSDDQLPFIYNPAAGYFASANEMNLPKNYPYKNRKLGFEWINPARYERIESVLHDFGKISIENSMQLQNDFYSVPAQRLIKLLSSLKSEDKQTQAALDLLNHWDFELDSDSAQAALHEVWVSRHLGGAFKSAILSNTAAQTFNDPDLNVMLTALENPHQWFSGPSEQKRNDVLLSSLKDAYNEMISLQGADNTKWQWGKLLVTLVTHPLSKDFSQVLQAQLNIGPLPRGGSLYTPNMSRYSPDDFHHIYGASFRVIIDVGNWDNSRAINFPGQSGDVNDPHYRDLVPLWQSGEYFPLLYSRDAIEAQTKQKIQLIPRL